MYFDIYYTTQNQKLQKKLVCLKYLIIFASLTENNYYRIVIPQTFKRKSSTRKVFFNRLLFSFLWMYMEMKAFVLFNFHENSWLVNFFHIISFLFDVHYFNMILLIFCLRDKCGLKMKSKILQSCVSILSWYCAYLKNYCYKG